MHRAALAVALAVGCAGCAVPGPWNPDASRERAADAAATSDPTMTSTDGLRATTTRTTDGSATRTTARAAASPSAVPSPPYLAAARWLDAGGTRVLRVRPTAAGRSGPPSGALWSELVRLVPDADRPGMRDQLLCHAVFAPDKPVWNLEPDRPEVGLAQTIAARCNPGRMADPDLASLTR